MDLEETSHKPEPLCLEGNARKNWFKFKWQFTDYLTSIKFDDEPSNVKAAKLRNLIGDAGLEKIQALGLEDSVNYDLMILKLDEWAESQKCSAYERLEFYNRVQTEDESFENFLNDVKHLIFRCNYGALTEEILRDKIITGVLSPRLKTLFRANPNVSLEVAIQMCRTSSLSEKQLLQLLSLKKKEEIKSNGVVDETNGAADLFKDVSVQTENSDMEEDNKHSEAEATAEVICKNIFTQTCEEVSKFSNRACSQATFSFTLENVNKLIVGDRKSSPPVYVHKLPWKLMVQVQKKDDSTKKTIGLYLECAKSKSTPWSCFVESKLKVLPLKAGVEPIIAEVEHLYCSTQPVTTWGRNNSMDWDVLVDPQKGYIEDDSVTFEAHVVVEDSEEVESK